MESEMEGSRKKLYIYIYIYIYILALLFQKKKRKKRDSGIGTTLIGTDTTHAKRGSVHLVPVPHL